MSENKIQKTKLKILQKKLKAEVERAEKQSKAFEIKMKEFQAELRGIDKVIKLIEEYENDYDDYEEEGDESSFSPLDEYAITALGELKFVDQVKQIVIAEGKDRELTHKLIAERIQELFPEKTRKHLRQAVINTMSKLKKEKPDWLHFERRNNIMRYRVAENYSSLVDVDEEEGTE